MTIHEIMTAKVDELKKDIIDAINNILIGRGIEEIELEEINGFNDIIRVTYDVSTSQVTYSVSKSIMIYDTETLLFFLNEVESGNYNITK